MLVYKILLLISGLVLVYSGAAAIVSSTKEPAYEDLAFPGGVVMLACGLLMLIVGVVL